VRSNKRAHLKDAQTALATGTGSRADVLGVEAKVASAELQRTRAEAATDAYEKQLRILMHDRGASAYTLGEDLRGIPRPNPYAHMDERSFTDAENDWSRAQLELIEARIDRRIADVRLAHALGADAAKQASPGAL
jgi:outer membrane protein TolC